MSDKTGGPAFPGGVNQTYTDREEGDPTQYGMTLLDYAAFKAMQGDLANGECGINSSDEALIARARLYYRMADAMLKVRDE